jgi:hypothetical protein
MYIPVNNNMNQQTAQVPNTIPQPFYMPAVTPSAQQPYQQTTSQVNQHKTHIPMDDYDLSDDSSVNEEPGNTTNDWQCAQNSKRRKLTKTQPSKSTNFNISQRNRFESLANADENTKESAVAHQSETHRPPPVFAHGVTDHPKMIKALEATVEAEQYKTKTMANNVVKINMNTAETYRKVVRFMKD